MADGRIEIEVVFDDGTIQKGKATIIKEGKEAGQKAGQNFEKNFSKRVKSSLSDLSKDFLKFASVAAAAFAGRAVIDAAARQEEAINRLNSSLQRIGEFSAQTSQNLQEFASGLQDITRFGDEAILEQLAFAQGLGATAEQSKAAVAAATDLATALNIDLTSATRNIARTLGGFAGELGEVIPELKNLTQEQLRNGAAIDLIADKYRGLAQRDIKGFNGAVDQLTNSFGDFLESLGAIVTKAPATIKVLTTLTQKFEDLAGFINLAFNPDKQQQIDDIDLKILSLQNRIAEINRVQKSGGFIDRLFGDDPRVLNDLNNEIQKLRDQRRQLQADLSQGVQADTTGTDLLKLSFEELRKKLEETKITKDQFDMALFNEQSQAQKDALTASLGESTNSFEKFGAAIQIQAKKIKVTNQLLADSFIKGLAGGIGKAFNNIGSAFARGENAFKAFGDTVIGIFGNLLSDLGQGFILQGTARVLAGEPGGAALIGAGAALQIFGGFLSAKSGGAAGASGGGVTPTQGGGVAVAPSDAVVNQNEVNTEPQTAVNVNIQGDVLDSDESGTRIVNLINDAFDKQGVVVSRNARFA